MPISSLEAAVKRGVERIGARFGRLGAKQERGFGRIDMRIHAEHSETRAYVAKAHLRTVVIVPVGLAVATAILATLIAVT